MAERVLEKMLERLMAAIVRGPSIDCRPHNSRQRMDLCELESLQDLAPTAVIEELLGARGSVRLAARVAPPPREPERAAEPAPPAPTAPPAPADPASASPAAADEQAPESEGDSVEAPAGADASGDAEGAPPAEAAKDVGAAEPPAPAPEDTERARARRAWDQQQSALRKLRHIAEEARTYEEDTGVYILHVGFPLLSIPKAPGASGSGARRVLAPLAFIPIKLSVSTGARASVEMACRYTGEDRVVANEALLSWIEQQTGERFDTIFSDESGDDPWREIGEITRLVCRALDLETPSWAAGDEPGAAEATSAAADAPKIEVGAEAAAEPEPGAPEETPTDGALDPLDPEGEVTAASDPLDAESQANEAALPPADPTPAASTAAPPTLTSAPRSDDARDTEVIPAAVLGLYPLSRQSLLRDTQAMIADGAPPGPIDPFLKLDPDAEAAGDRGEEVQARQRCFEEERFVQLADPCQARAVRLAREAGGLVIHGPPGTGKSQTITNIIADHLSRGERVLFVCDKRTALDVVARRLQHVGLGDLCALIHDAQHDQRSLYMSVREQVENLTDMHPRPRADKRIAKIDAEMQALHDELLEVWRALMLDPDAPAGAGSAMQAGGEDSFHDLVGRWLGIEVDPAYRLAPEPLAALDPDALAQREVEVRDALQRGREIDWPGNPWPEAAGVALDAFLRTPADRLRARLDAVRRAAAIADDAIVEGLSPLDPARDPQQQARHLAALADQLAAAMNDPPDLRARWAAASETEVAAASAALDQARPSLDLLRAATPDAEIDLVLASAPPVAAGLAQDLAALAEYRAIAGKWWSFVAFGPNKRAGAVLRRCGLPRDGASAARLESALQAERAALVLRQAMEQVGITAPPKRPDLLAAAEAHGRTLRLLADARAAGNEAHAAVASALRGEAPADAVLAALRAAPARAEAITNLSSALREPQLFSAQWLTERHAEACSHQPASATVQTLIDRFGTLETALRIESITSALPQPIAEGARSLLAGGASAEEGWAALLRAHLESQITARLTSTPALQQLDGRRIETALARLSGLHAEKMDLVRDSIASLWLTRQRERLLAGTGTRLNSMGAEIKRRLLTRGKRAMRLRQVIHMGRAIEGGDPLFDLRPVWMTSPETAAQIFPREQMFDLIVFDEASQCRLEDALPPLVRAKRVVVAGDPKQLPPTRFFESAVVISEDEQIETEQDLFEAQQSEIEDLLGAALSIEIEQSHLDVHYRSRNADLISFSNEHFYGSRLQAIPGHPKNRASFAPLSLVHAGGIYQNSQNEIEARRVVEIVRDLLRRAETPTIGIACFNVVQRDLILDCLDEAAEQDAQFGRKLAKARQRRGDGSFEGLFVKNLENVQGDERDHIIISTTYGPNAEGRFYRRFGPLLQAGGGRRLNVLVTRARQEVHLVTSIPPEYYRALPPIPDGQTPGGGWLLLAYLRYAELLGEIYTKAHEERQASRDAAARAQGATVREAPTTSPSTLAESLAQALARRSTGSEVYWGNDGFCVDIALDHPTRTDDVTIGLLTDMTRYRAAADPVEWELFRTEILRSQGWELQRLWAPAIFRDLTGTQEQIETRLHDHLSRDEDPDALRVWRDANAAE